MNRNYCSQNIDYLTQIIHESVEEGLKSSEIIEENLKKMMNSLMEHLKKCLSEKSNLDFESKIIFSNSIIWSSKLGPAGGWLEEIPFYVPNSDKEKNKILFLNYLPVLKLGISINSLAYEYLGSIPNVVKIYCADYDSPLKFFNGNLKILEINTKNFSITKKEKKSLRSFLEEDSFSKMLDKIESKKWLDRDNRKELSVLSKFLPDISLPSFRVKHEIDAIKMNLPFKPFKEFDGKADEKLLKLIKYISFCHNFGMKVSYLFPSKTHIFKNLERGTGGFFISLSEDVFSNWSICLKSISAIVNMKYREFAIIDWFNKANFESMKSGIAAIMARNMSHNIGSHVIADLVSKGVDASQGGELNAFYRYLQNRMDFIAQITTEIPSWTYPAYFNKELMRIFYESFLLIDRLGVSEGLKAYNWPENWKDGCMRGKIIVRTCINKDDNFNWVINEYHMGKLEDDLQLAIPGGIVGYHAFYIIIENMIRNSAKHDYATRHKRILDKREDENIENTIYFIYKNDQDVYVYRKISEKEISKEDNIDENLDLSKCRAITIESSCFSSSGIENNKIELKGKALNISGIRRLYIGCTANCEHCVFHDESQTYKCRFLDNSRWKQSALTHHVLSNNEWKSIIPKIKEASARQYEAKAGIEKKHDDKIKEFYKEIDSFLVKIPLRINVKIDDMDEKDYVWVTVWDDMPQYANYNYEKGNDTKKEVSGYIPEDGIKKRKVEPNGINLFGFLNDRLRQSFIKDTGELKKENWGLVELKICAGYLQNRKPEEIGDSGKDIIEYGNDCFNLNSGSDYIIPDKEKDNPNVGYPKMIIKAIPVDKTGKEMPESIVVKKSTEKPKLKKGDIYFLGYRFWMKKPKIVAITGDKKENLRECPAQGGK